MKVTFNQRHHGTLPPPRYGTTPDLTHQEERYAARQQITMAVAQFDFSNLFVAFFSVCSRRIVAVRCRRRISFSRWHRKAPMRTIHPRFLKADIRWLRLDVRKVQQRTFDTDHKETAISSSAIAAPPTGNAMYCLP